VVISAADRLALEAKGGGCAGGDSPSTAFFKDTTLGNILLGFSLASSEPSGLSGPIRPSDGRHRQGFGQPQISRQR